MARPAARRRYRLTRRSSSWSISCRFRSGLPAPALSPAPLRRLLLTGIQAPRAIERHGVSHALHPVSSCEGPIEAVWRCVADLLRAEDASGPCDPGYAAGEVNRVAVEIAGAL